MIVITKVALKSEAAKVEQFGHFFVSSLIPVLILFYAIISLRLNS